MSKKIAAVTTPLLELKYSLAELPSSQHRGGLAGLILMMRWLERFQNKVGICQIASLDAHTAIFNLNLGGLQTLMDQVYAASVEEQKSNSAWEGVEPVRTEEVVELDPKTGKQKKKKQYVYLKAVPRGAFLRELDTSPDSSWIKLWTNMIWGVMRGAPTARKPFENRAEGKPTNDAEAIWKHLSMNPEGAIGQPGTYYLGAQSTNSETVEFLDTAKNQFLLHFWPFVAQVYVLQTIDTNGKHKFFDGFIIGVPDVCYLDAFCDDFDLMLKTRGHQMAGYRPLESVIDVPEEAGLDAAKRLSDVLEQTTEKLTVSDLILGVDVFMAKPGKPVKLLYAGRIEPQAQMIDEYTTLKKALTDPIFKRQRLLNLIQDRSWYSGFNAILAALPVEPHGDSLPQGLLSKSFQHDARVSFKSLNGYSSGGTENMVAPCEQSEKVESLVLKVIERYIFKKLEEKYELQWEIAKQTPKGMQDFSDKKEHVVKDCFYSIRSRTGSDFINYFASTICSVPQGMSREQFIVITQTLYEDTEKVRTLCMLALAARA